jgi:lantibiotic modifying enzyme
VVSGTGIDMIGDTTAWRPLLDGAAPSDAWRAIEAIAAELAGVLRDSGDLAHGALGADLAVFFYYLHAVTGDHRHRELGSAAIERAAEALADSVLPAALFDGFVRIAWAVEHLRRRGWLDAPDDACEAIDDALLGALERGEPQHFDLMSGLCGQAVYAFERAPLGGGARLLERIAARLAAAADAQAAGHAWRSDPRWLSPAQRAVHPDGFLDLGLSHGTPCAMRVLAELAARGLAAPELVASAVAWLLTCEGDAAPSGLPYFVGGARPSQPARLAWCYGDPGIAIALLGTARAMARTDWAAEARRLAERAAGVPLDRSGVLDAGLCHGAAGLAHAFRRIGHVTGDAVYDDAARRWWSDALAMRRPDAAGAGLLAYDVQQREHVRDHALLTGSAGIGLALLAAVSALEPAWDRLLLCSTAPGDAEATP